jgi:Ca2+-binding EF-hand superfamily protein
LDKNNTGVLSKREIKNMMRPLHNEINPGDIESIIEKADVNKDGFISFTQFINAV